MNIEWKRILMNDMPYSFLLEVVLRSVIMFIIILLTLRASGKRGIKQLSVFELVLIIGLGSAAGDPMFYKDVGILNALTVFIVVISLYIAVTRLTDKVTWFEKVMEGEPSYLIKDGKIMIDAFKASGLTKDEFFSELRVLNVEHLGQVKTVLIETSGLFSVLFYADDEVKPGLPIFPGPLSIKTKQVQGAGPFACVDCGQLENPEKEVHECPSCSCNEWIIPINTKRIS
ncbi:DUF421 domain-containing protein [Mucilaginibacter terrae]|uniref:DUF421 domain-containing protein n=1 Tax=Mucilaginibacter terrae TaxID=1955052 RepID=UPI00362769C6